MLRGNDRAPRAKSTLTRNRNEEPELPRDEVPKLSRDLNWCGVGSGQKPLAMLLTRAMVPKPKGEALV